MPVRKKAPEDLTAKKALALEVIDRLKKEYPDAGCTLDYDHAWQLLVSVRLAAQCTDARVNIVVEDLFAKYPNVAALAAAEPEDIEAIVKPCGLGRSKARDISACMRVLRDKYGCQVPTTFEELLALPGVGRKSANLIMGDVLGKRAIVTDIPGTTRDTVEQTVTLGRHLVRLVDTAGIRDTQDVIEKIGVDRSMEAAKDCDVALYVLDDSKPMTEEDRRAMGATLEAPEAIAILNKQDLPGAIEPSDLPFSYIVPVSCKDGTGFDLLEQAFDMLFPDDAPCDGSLLTNARQAGAILRAKKSVDSAVQSLRAGMTPDAVLVDLEAAMDALGEVTGRTMREDITNRIFERFCVGK